MRLCEDTRYEIGTLFLRPYDGWHLENLGLCNSGIENVPTSFCLGTLTIEYGNPMVENISTELGYDFQSLCGEVGGTFGLMLGLCLLDLVSLKQWKINGSCDFSKQSFGVFFYTGCGIVLQGF
jgi:hypothetical protein